MIVKKRVYFDLYLPEIFNEGTNILVLLVFLSYSRIKVIVKEITIRVHFFLSYNQILINF